MIFTIHYFHINYNTPCLPPPPPPQKKKIHKYCKSFLRIVNPKRKMETMLMQNFLRVNKVYHGSVKVANKVERVVSKRGQLQPRFTSVTRNRQTWGWPIISKCSIQNPLIIYTSKVVWNNFTLSCFSTHFSISVSLKIHPRRPRDR